MLPAQLCGCICRKAGTVVERWNWFKVLMFAPDHRVLDFAHRTAALAQAWSEMLPSCAVSKQTTTPTWMQASLAAFSLLLSSMQLIWLFDNLTSACKPQCAARRFWRHCWIGIGVLKASNGCKHSQNRWAPSSHAQTIACTALDLAFDRPPEAWMPTTLPSADN